MKANTNVVLENQLYLFLRNCNKISKSMKWWVSIQCSDVCCKLQTANKRNNIFVLQWRKWRRKTFKLHTTLNKCKCVLNVSYNHTEIFYDQNKKIKSHINGRNQTQIKPELKTLKTAADSLCSSTDFRWRINCSCSVKILGVFLWILLSKYKM